MITELSTFSFHYELVMNFLWNSKDSLNRYELYIALWNRTLNCAEGDSHQSKPFNLFTTREEKGGKSHYRKIAFIELRLV